MAFGEDWATLGSIFNGEVVSEPVSGGGWLDGAMDTVSDLGGAIYDGAGSWLSQLMDFELQKESLSYKNQLANQQAVLGAVESEQQTGSIPASPNYRQIETGLSGGNKDLLLVAGLGLVAYFWLK